jgi:hypothetical protein
MIQLLLGNDAIVLAALMGGEKRKCFRRLARQLTALGVLDFRGIRIDAEHIAIPRLHQKIDQISRSAADDQNGGVSIRRNVRQIVRTIIGLERSVAAVDVFRRLPIRIEGLETSGELDGGSGGRVRADARDRGR